MSMIQKRRMTEKNLPALGAGACCQLSAVSCQPQKDSSLCPWGRITNVLVKVRNGRLKKMLKMKIAPYEFVENKGAKKCSQ